MCLLRGEQSDDYFGSHPLLSQQIHLDLELGDESGFFDQHLPYIKIFPILGLYFLGCPIKLNPMH